MQLFTAKTVINLHENACGETKFIHNFANKRLSLKFSQRLLQILLEQFLNDTYVVSGMLFWKKLYYFEVELWWNTFSEVAIYSVVLKFCNFI